MIQNQCTEVYCLLYTDNERSEREIKETIPFTIITKIIKHLGINLPKEAKDLYSENYKTLIKDIKMTQTGGSIWLYYPKQSTDAMQSLSNYQWHFSQN